MSASWCRTKYCYLNYGIKLFKYKRGFQKDFLKSYLIDTTRNFTEGQKSVGKDEYQKVYYTAPTEPGSKKDVSGLLPTAYSPTYVEAAWYDWWDKQGYFTPEYQQHTPRSEERFVVCLPPPNVTGTLHLGHALTNSIQDAIIRWKRMNGIETVWIPGCDHAGIATQVVVEKQLKRNQNKTRFDIGRERFLEEVWKWKNEKGNTIYEQMKLMGSSLDWGRACFTMDEKLSKAVTESFVRLYEDGLIYRSKRLVNWSCALQSTISDIEVDNIPIEGPTLMPVPGYTDPVEFGLLTSFTYPVEDGGEITVSTTRLETMLGDVAVAVHPDDARYRQLQGKCVVHPITGDKLPIICDDFVDREFGTGAVKITPAHDYVDFDVGLRHNLPSKTVINNQGLMENTSPEFTGLRRFDCRRRLGEALAEKGLLKGSASHTMTIPLCSRSKDVIEPLLMDQWYLSCKDMAQKAMEVVENKELRLVPSMYEYIWFDYMKNARDWCISRQLWWGHRIPAYRATVKGQTSSTKWIIARNEEDALAKATEQLKTPAENIHLQQDEDVLDTWFSSGLFPFSVHGWPDQTNDFQKYYPTSLLETGSDIIFFWVARMVMLGLKLTNQLPFKEVLLHGILRDSRGRKMSKSLGNVIDPIDVIYGISLQDLHKKLDNSHLDEKEIATARAGQKKEFPSGIPEAGADALRFSLCSLDFKVQEINTDITTVKSNRHFCNKIWQGFKFVQFHLGAQYSPNKSCDVTDEIDQWILSRLSHMVQSCDNNFHSHDLHHVTKALHTFWLSDFCDIYLECIKPVLNSNADLTAARQTLFTCVDTFLRAASPFMPFLTEELYQRLHIYNDDRAESVCIAPYPVCMELPTRKEDLEDTMNTIKSIATNILSVAHEFSIKPKDMKVSIVIEDDDLHRKITLDSFSRALTVISKTSTLHVGTSIDREPDGCSVSVVRPGVQVYCHLKRDTNNNNSSVMHPDTSLYHREPALDIDISNELFSVKGVIDPVREVEKLKDRIIKLDMKLEKLIKKKRRFNDKSHDVIRKEKEEMLQEQRQSLEDRIKQIEEFL